jgi:putative hydrolase of the HAD superfamily
MIKHVSFDLWGTLIKSNPEFKVARTKIFVDEFGEKTGYIDKLIKSTEKFVDTLNEECLGHITTDHIIGMILKDIGKTFDKKMIVNLRDRIFTEFLEHPPTLIQDNISDILKEIKDMGISMNILSNTGMIPGYQLTKILDSIREYIPHDLMIFSDEEVSSKPSGFMYGKVQSISYALTGSVIMTNILHVGDNPYTDGSCVDYGMQFYDVTKHPIDNLVAHIKVCNSQSTHPHSPAIK